MPNTNAFELQHSDLNGFLFADIGVEAGGMDLSVVSAIAREGIDPWAEAARLAKLPLATAIDELARMIATMPATLWPQPAATEIATRLVALLPSPAAGQSTVLKRIESTGLFGATAPVQPGAKAALKPELLTVILLGLAILAGSAIGVAHNPPAPPPIAATPANPPAPPGND